MSYIECPVPLPWVLIKDSEACARFARTVCEDEHEHEHEHERECSSTLYTLCVIRTLLICIQMATECAIKGLK